MADMIYGNGKNTPYGEQNQTFYYERKALQRLKYDVVYQQWCDLRHQPQNNGKEFRISVWHNTYGRLFFRTYDDAEQFRRKLTPNDFSENNLNTNTLYVYPYYFNYTQPNLVEFNLKQGKVFILG